MDAHDAKSYPGEPTTNYIKHGTDGIPTDWWGDGSNQSIGTKSVVDITDNNLKYNGYPTILWTPGDSYNVYLNGTSDIDQSALSTVWTFSCYVRAQDGGTLRTSDNSLFVYFYRGTASYPSDSGTGTITDVGGGWHRVHLSVSGTSNYAGLIGFSSFRAEARFYLSGAQLEKKTYPTPFVTGVLNSGEVYDGRPATTNLMIHGNVGTGTSFYDSSPSKHTVSGNGDVTHSSTQSKFSGGSIYFDGGGSAPFDYLSAPDSDDWNVGSGDFTVDMWINGSDYTNVDYPALFSQYVDDNNFLALYFAGASRTLLWGRTGGSGYSTLDVTGTTWTEGVWYHVALVRNGTKTLFFRDGVMLQVKTESWTVGDYASPLYVGWWGYGGSGYAFNGYIDEFRFTKGTALWIDDFTPPTRRNLSAPVVDRSGSNNGGNFNTTDMTGVATYRVGEVIRPIGSAVWNFDGTDDYINGGKGCRVGNTRRKSIEAWVRGVTTGTKTLLFMGDHLNSYKWQWTTLGGGQYMTGSGYGTRYYWSDAPLTAAGWHHWVDVVDEDQGAGDRVKRYVDGILLTPNALTTDTGDSFYDGTDMYVDVGMANLGSGATNLWDGEIGAIRLYRNALTWEQVKENFNQQRNRFGV
jgi:hypothetical protein